MRSQERTAGSDGCVLYRVSNVSVPSKKLTGQTERKCSCLNEGKAKRHIQAMREEKMITFVFGSSGSSDFHAGITIICLHDFDLVNRE